MNINRMTACSSRQRLTSIARGVRAVPRLILTVADACTSSRPPRRHVTKRNLTQSFSSRLAPKEKYRYNFNTSLSFTEEPDPEVRLRLFILYSYFI